MDRIFRVDFYPHEWLTLTGHMTPVQKGIFIDIVALIYANRGPIRNDPNHFGRVSNCSSRLARSVFEKLVEHGDLQITRNGFVTQKRCESELNLKRTHLEASARGGRTRNEKHPQSQKNNDLEPTPPLSSLATSSPSPSPTVVSGHGNARATTEFFERVQKIINSPNPMRLSRIETWMQNGATEKIIIDVITDLMAKRNGEPPSTIVYFEKAVTRAIKDQQQPMRQDDEQSNTFGNSRKDETKNHNSGRYPTKSERADAAIRKSRDEYEEHIAANHRDGE
jgi:uncharacterized protein YdaU (DUF1376 family)